MNKISFWDCFTSFAMTSRSSLRVTNKSVAFIYQKNDFIVIANESSSEAISEVLKVRLLRSSQ